MSTPDTAVHTEKHGAAQLITINRPASRNAVNSAVANGIAAALEELHGDEDLRVGVITGAGGTFSAGMDLKAAAAGESAAVADGGFAGITEARNDKPLIAAVEGHALGGGFEIALSCDLIVAADGATFALPEVKRGLIAGGGGTVRLPRRIPHHLAMELLLTGEAIPARRAAEIGLVNRVVPDGSAASTALELAERIGANAPLALAAVKSVLRAGDGAPEHTALTAQREAVEHLRNSADFAEGARAFAEKRAPEWRGR
ncbi:crotonase/enoyl-CoA hydratase family protein [Salinifilum aidingensis]